MKYFDEFLQKEVTVHEEVTPEIGVEKKLEDPGEFKDIFKEADKDEN